MTSASLDRSNDDDAPQTVEEVMALINSIPQKRRTKAARIITSHLGDVIIDDYEALSVKLSKLHFLLSNLAPDEKEIDVEAVKKAEEFLFASAAKLVEVFPEPKG